MHTCAVHAHMHAYTHTRIHACLHTFCQGNDMKPSTCTHACMYTRMYTYLMPLQPRQRYEPFRMNTCIQFAQTCMHTCTHTHLLSPSQRQRYAAFNMNTCTHTHTCTHACIHTFCPLSQGKDMNPSIFWFLYIISYRGMVLVLAEESPGRPVSVCVCIHALDTYT